MKKTLSILAVSFIVVVCIGQGCSGFISNSDGNSSSSVGGPIGLAEERLIVFDKGAFLYQKQCAACHGMEIESSAKRNINFDRLKTAAGSSGTIDQMQSLLLSDDDMMAVVFALNNDRNQLLDRLEQETGSREEPVLSLQLSKRVILLSRGQFFESLKNIADGILSNYSWPAWTSMPFNTLDLNSHSFSTSPYARTIQLEDVRQLAGMTGSLSSALQANLDYNKLGCSSSTTFNDDCIKKVVHYIGAKSFRRPLNSDEVSRVLTASKVDGLTSSKERLSLAIQMVLLSPKSITRTEIGNLAETGTGKSLTQYEIASMLSFVLANSPPDAPLLALAEQGLLTQPEILDSEVDRLSRSTLGEAAASRFFKEYFKYETHVPEKPVSGPYREGHFDLLSTDLSELIQKVTRENLDADAFGELMTTGEVSLTRSTAAYYGVNPTTIEGREVLNLSNERAGVFTHPRWLMGYSAFDYNNPVERGKYLRESILCGGIPSAPLVVFNFNANADLTLRDKLAAHVNEASCKQCHDLMDPLGMPFEQYDHFGGFRTVEKSLPVDTSGGISGSIDQDGSVSDPDELVTRLSNSTAVRQCLNRHVLQYYSGATELPTPSQVEKGLNTYGYLDLIKGSVKRSALERRF